MVATRSSSVLTGATDAPQTSFRSNTEEAAHAGNVQASGVGRRRARTRRGAGGRRLVRKRVGQEAHVGGDRPPGEDERLRLELTGRGRTPGPVSYTHLTLPTIYSV